MDPAIPSKPIERFLFLQSNFCRPTGQLSESDFSTNITKLHSIENNACPLFSLTSSGNFSMQCVPVDYYLALKLQHSSVQIINEQRAGVMAK